MKEIKNFSLFKVIVVLRATGDTESIGKWLEVTFAKLARTCDSVVGTRIFTPLEL